MCNLIRADYTSRCQKLTSSSPIGWAIFFCDDGPASNITHAQWFPQHRRRGGWEALFCGVHQLTVPQESVIAALEVRNFQKDP
jgi:hypothetical protein